MRAIRLAVSHPDGAEVAAIAARLRGATVEPCADPAQFRGPPDGCDAVMLLGPAGRSTADWLRTARAHVLAVADVGLPSEVKEGLFTIAQNVGVQLAVVNPDRYLSSRQLIRNQLPIPLGEPELIRLHRWEPAAPPQPSGLPDPLLRDLDVVLWLAGRRPNRVFAVESKSEDAAGRYVQVHLGFPGGGMAVLDYTDRLPPGDDYRSLSVIASSGAAYADDHQNVQLVYRGGHPQAVRTDERAGLLAAIAQDFVDAIRSRREPEGGAKSWRDVFAVAGAVEWSLTAGQAVTPEDR
jgi:predicted dehydrogenase